LQLNKISLVSLSGHLSFAFKILLQQSYFILALSPLVVENHKFMRLDELRLQALILVQKKIFNDDVDFSC